MIHNHIRCPLIFLTTNRSQGYYEIGMNNCPQTLRNLNVRSIITSRSITIIEGHSSPQSQLLSWIVGCIHLTSKFIKHLPTGFFSMRISKNSNKSFWRSFPSDASTPQRFRRPNPSLRHFITVTILHGNRGELRSYET